MPQSKGVHKEYMRKLRGSQKGSQDDGVHGGGSQYPAIIYALADPEKRRKLEKVYRSLKDANQDMNVYYGHPSRGISFDLIGEMLGVTR